MAHLPRKPPRFISDELTGFVYESLRKEWGPVFTSGRLGLKYSQDTSRRARNEITYTWIHSNKYRGKRMQFIFHDPTEYGEGNRGSSKSYDPSAGEFAREKHLD